MSTKQKPNRHGLTTAAPAGDLIARAIMDRKDFLTSEVLGGRHPEIDQRQANLLEVLAGGDRATDGLLIEVARTLPPDLRCGGDAKALEKATAFAVYHLARCCLVSYRRSVVNSREIVLRLVGRGRDVAASIARHGLGKQADGRPAYASLFDKRSSAQKSAPVAAPEQRAEPETK